MCDYTDAAGATTSTSLACTDNKTCCDRDVSISKSMQYRLYVPSENSEMKCRDKRAIHPYSEGEIDENSTKSTGNESNSSWKWIGLLSMVYFLLYWLGTTFVLKAMYQRLPLRITSRIVGRLVKTRIPRRLREPMYRSYGWLFGVKLQEAEFANDLSRYESMSAFFQRRLRRSTRRIDQHVCLISPADGRVLSFGPVEDGHLQQVKGIFYSLHGLLGLNTWTETVKQYTALYSQNPKCSEHMHPVRSSVELNVNLQPCVTSEGIDYSPVSVAKKTHSDDIGKRF